ncbi:MAG: MBL fold metallo-hydrolase [Actinomycetota bacterium]
MKIQAVGQSTFVVTLADGRTILLDPWFSEHFLARREIPLPFAIKAVPRCTAVLASHNHIDHVDRVSLLAARQMGATLVGPRGVTRRGQRWGVADCRPLRRGERLELPGFSVEAVFATHPLCVAPIGFLVTDSDGTTLYHSGDTRYDPRIVEDLAGRRVDAACLQIAAVRYPVIGRDGMNIEEAARLAEEIQAGVAIPMHYHVKGKVENASSFALRAAPHGRVLEPGASFEVLAGHGRS